MLLFSVCPRGGRAVYLKKMLVIVGRPKMHMIMEPYGILFKVEIITRRGTCKKKNPIWVPKKIMNLQDEFGGGKNAA